MACDCCKSLEIGRLLNADIVPHHSSFNELEACCSTEDCCPLCDCILQQFEAKIHQRRIEPDRYNKAKVLYCIPRYAWERRDEVEIWHGVSEVDFFVDAQEDGRYDKPGRISARVELFVARGSKLADSGIISGRPTSPYAHDETCFQLARKWRDTCLGKHGKSCLEVTKRALPTRIIDVGPANGSHEPWLRVTKREKGEWVALSHCWGSTSNFVTDSGNLMARQRLISLKDMPQTFYDAVITTRQLGYRYLWIDSLCILQDDHKDWVAESVRMREYYKHAIITISADSASGDDVGFLNHRRVDPEVCKITLASNVEIGVRTEIGCPTFRDRDTYVARRAWTLQEFVLAPRSLLYTSEQIVWECHSRKYCESDDNSQADSWDDNIDCMKRFFLTPFIGGDQFPDLQEFFDPYSRWYSLVNDYFSRDLTIKKDILPAISGLAREIQKQTGKTYAAGIWIEDIHKALLWTNRGAGKAPEAYIAPSWSWAALEALPGVLSPTDDLYWNIVFHSYPEIEERRASLISHEIVMKEEDPFGCVSSGSIWLRGRSLLARDWQGKTKPYLNSYKVPYKSHRWEGDMGLDNLDVLVCYFDIFEEDLIQAKLLDVTLMFQISSWIWNRNAVATALALLLLPINDHSGNTYRRVGIVEVPIVDGLAEENWEIKDICIV
ncbi:heterokaryon incompatibility protein-domain-containing protein [Bisporella sp. PMI_857]|nr:heterokaryon incompatibility protein-domain-containing protein [Bisporella sp. PMI_857]